MTEASQQQQHRDIPMWLHSDCFSKRDSEFRLEYGKKVLNGKNGLFFVRPSKRVPANDPPDYIMVILYHGKVTHHKLTFSDDKGTWLVNGKTYGLCPSLNSLVEVLSKKRPDFPVQLYAHVPNDINFAAAKANMQAETEGSGTENQQKRSLPVPSDVKKAESSATDTKQEAESTTKKGPTRPAEAGMAHEYNQPKRRQQTPEQPRDTEKETSKDEEQPQAQHVARGNTRQSQAGALPSTISQMEESDFARWDPTDAETPVPHPRLPGNTEELLDLMNEYPKFIVTITRKATEVPLGFNLTPRRHPQQSEADDFEFNYVIKVDVNGLAYREGLRTGDILFKVNNVTYENDYREVVGILRTALTLTLIVSRPAMLLESLDAPNRADDEIAVERPLEDM